MKNKILPLVLILLCCSAWCEDPVAEAKVVVRERTVYIPYEKLKETFEKEGRGVFLPYEEFLKLWNAGQPREKPPEEIKPPAEAVIAGGSYNGTARESAVRFEVTYKVKALGKAWSELALPLKNVAVESVTVSDPLAVFAPKGDGYSLLLPKPGEYTLTLAFSVRVDSKPGQRKIEFGIPPTAVSRLELSIPEKDLRVEVTPKMAATVATPEGEITKVLAFVGNADQVAVTWMPPVSRVEKGEALTIASQAMHVELGERILRLDTAISYKIERNEEDQFKLKMPTDMRLLSVKGNNIREWSTENGILLVRLHSPVKDTYALVLRFERILETTPDKLDVPFPAIVGALREDGFITLAHESGLRLRVENSSGVSQIDPRELPESLNRPNLLASFRYLAQPLSLSLKIEQVQPQVQSAMTAVTILGNEEDSVAGFIDYQIAKVGIFTLKMKFENRWEVASIGDPQTVEDFQSAVDGQYKVLTVNLKNKALGNFRLPFKLSGPSRAAAGQLTLEPVQVLDTQQDKGLFGISAPKAFKLTTVERNKMSSADVQKLVATGLLAQLPADFEFPLAYTYNQQPASVKISLEKRQTEVRVTGYHSVIVSEFGLEMTHKLEYFVEFAGIDHLMFSAPSSLDLYDVKCPGFKQLKKSSEKNGRTTWEILLQDKTLGAIPVSINHKENLKGLEQEKPQEVAIPDVHAEEVNLQTGFIAVRKESALEIEPKVSNLEPLEPVNLPGEMRSSNVYLAFRYFQPERSLTLKLTRHTAINVASTVVDLMRITTVLSEERSISVRAELWIENAKSEQHLALALPKNASIRALAVNGVGVNPLQREGGGTLVKLISNGGTPFPLQILYTIAGDSGTRMGAFGGMQLKTLEVLDGVPVNKIEADLYVPEDYAYMGFEGTLHPRPVYESNTLSWIKAVALGNNDPAVIVHADESRFGPTPPLIQALTTDGRLFQFQTLYPVGTINFRYCDRKLFTFIDVLVFAVALLLGWYLSKRRNVAPLWICAAFVLVPLCVGWFATSAYGELFSSWLGAGVVLAASLLIARMRQGWIGWREARLAAAPDPFLEEAPDRSGAPTEAKTEAKAEQKGEDSTKAGAHEGTQTSDVPAETPQAPDEEAAEGDADDKAKGEEK